MRELLRQPAKERGLLVVVAHEVLADAEAVAVDPPDADQEGGGPGPRRRGRSSRCRGTPRGAGRSAPARPAGENGDGGRLDRAHARERHVPVAHFQVDPGLDEEELAALVLDAHPFDEFLERDGDGPAPPLLLLDRGHGHEPFEALLQGERLGVAGRRHPQHLALEPLEPEHAGRGVAGGPGRSRGGATQALEATRKIRHSRLVIPRDAPEGCQWSAPRGICPFRKAPRRAFSLRGEAPSTRAPATAQAVPSFL